jgi:hypothetical protein
MLGCLSPAPHARHEASTSWPRRAPRRGGCPRPQALPPSRPAEATTDTYTLAKRTHVVFLYVRGRSDHAWPSSWLRRIGAVVHGSHVARAEYLRTMVILSAIVGLFEVSTGSKVLAAAVRRLSHRQSKLQRAVRQWRERAAHTTVYIFLAERGTPAMRLT